MQTIPLGKASLLLAIGVGVATAVFWRLLFPLTLMQAQLLMVINLVCCLIAMGLGIGGLIRKEGLTPIFGIIVAIGVAATLFSSLG